MEVAAAKPQLLPFPSMAQAQAQDPNSPSSSTSSSSPSSAAASPRPVVPRTIDTTPFPTTFVQADTASFKQVVQMLTGSGDATTTPPSSQRPPAAAKNTHLHHHAGGGVAKKPAFKLYERRGVHKNFKMIAPLAMAAAAAARKPATEVLSPSVLDFPSLALSPVTPLLADPFNRSSPASASAAASPEEEAAAIAKKGFFLHPSPRSAEPPRLLPLFPVTSPRAAAAAASPAVE
uniref:VQ domain-containing protein n=1 Tax=Leersia perrieri TaxID=77586 RepID=A0A0D9WIR3_9ORYZ